MDDSEKRECSMPFWMDAAGYYLAGRHMAFCDFPTVTAVSFHHALEMLMKAGVFMSLLDTMQPDEACTHLKDTYGHNLDKLWSKIKGLYPSGGLTRFNRAIGRLGPFEEVRYPTYKSFVMIGIQIREDDKGVFKLPPEVAKAGGKIYWVSLAEVDKAFNAIWPLIGLNTWVLEGMAEQSALMIQPTYGLHNKYALYKQKYYWWQGTSDGIFAPEDHIDHS